MRDALWLRAFVAATCLLMPQHAHAQATSYEQLQTFSSVLSQVRTNYMDSVETGYLVRGAITGMLERLDPHSHYTSRADFELRAAWMAGQLGTPGIYFEDGDGGPVVLSVRRESPAWKAGVQPGDRLVAINDTVVGNMNAQAAELRMIGEKGSRVKLKLARGSTAWPDSIKLNLKRAVLEARAVSSVRMVDPTTGYIRLDEFLPEAGKEVEKGIEELRGRKMTQLILDLRGNPGGSVQAMVDVASLFLPKGSLIVKAQGRRKTGLDNPVVTKAGAWQALPVIVLIDEGSASSSEMLAGSLQDHDRALIVGRRSFGKALMQTALPVANGDVVWLTVARVLTPSGRIIQRRYQGLDVRQYYAGAGQGGAAEDTVPQFRTDAGRIVRGGGGIRPDVERPAARLPAWFATAADTGLVTRISDSVAQTLKPAPDAQVAWRRDASGWDNALVTPLLAQASATLGVTSQVDTSARARIGRIMATRAAEVRWGADAGEDFRLAVDPDVQFALVQFPRMSQLLKGQ